MHAHFYVLFDTGIIQFLEHTSAGPPLRRAWRRLSLLPVLTAWGRHGSHGSHQGSPVVIGPNSWRTWMPASDWCHCLLPVLLWSGCTTGCTFCGNGEAGSRPYLLCDHIPDRQKMMCLAGLGCYYVIITTGTLDISEYFNTLYFVSLYHCNTAPLYHCIYCLLLSLSLWHQWSTLLLVFSPVETVFGQLVAQVGPF